MEMNNDHFLIWVKGAPIYGKQTNSSIVHFVDTYITCDTEDLEPHIAILHKHHVSEHIVFQENMCKSDPKCPIERTNQHQQLDRLSWNW